MAAEFLPADSFVLLQGLVLTRNVFLLQVLVIGFASVQVVVGYGFACAKQVKYYIRNGLFGDCLVPSNKTQKEILNDMVEIQPLSLGTSLCLLVNVTVVTTCMSV